MAVQVCLLAAVSAGSKMGRIATNSNMLYGFRRNVSLRGDDKKRNINSHEKNRLQNNSIWFREACGDVSASRSLRDKVLLVEISKGTRKKECVASTKEIIDKASIITEIQKNICFCI